MRNFSCEKAEFLNFSDLIWTWTLHLKKLFGLWLELDLVLKIRAGSGSQNMAVCISLHCIRGMWTLIFLSPVLILFCNFTIRIRSGPGRHKQSDFCLTPHKYKSGEEPRTCYQQTQNSYPIRLQQRKPHSWSCWRQQESDPKNPKSSPFTPLLHVEVGPDPDYRSDSSRSLRFPFGHGSGPGVKNLWKNLPGVIFQFQQ